MPNIQYSERGKHVQLLRRFNIVVKHVSEPVIFIAISVSSDRIWIQTHDIPISSR